MAKSKPRIDFKTEEFSQLVDSHGYLFKWSRATLCPCENNPDTGQPDIECPVCEGGGWLYFNPEDPKQAVDSIEIRGIVTDVTREPQVYERFGQWIMGVSQVTVKPEHVISYGDRLVCVDSIMPHYQVITADGSNIIERGPRENNLRYIPLEVNLIRGISRIYQTGVDFVVNSSNQIEWQIAELPPANALLTVHYNYNPVYIVQQHRHVFRDTEVATKVPTQTHKKMPIQAMIKLAFLTGGGT